MLHRAQRRVGPLQGHTLSLWSVRSAGEGIPLLRAALDHGYAAQWGLSVLAAASMTLSSAAGLVFFTWSQFLFCSA